MLRTHFRKSLNTSFLAKGRSKQLIKLLSTISGDLAVAKGNLAMLSESLRKNNYARIMSEETLDLVWTIDAQLIVLSECLGIGNERS